jgi:DNA/RNA endonuclease G (NUC1)
MAAAGNYSGNKNAKFQTFTYANVVPQNQYNNGGIWNTFERYSRDLVMSGKCESV